jgi:hypothetical protein
MDITIWNSEINTHNRTTQNLKLFMSHSNLFWYVPTHWFPDNQSQDFLAKRVAITPVRYLLWRLYQVGRGGGPFGVCLSNQIKTTFYSILSE